MFEKPLLYPIISQMLLLPGNGTAVKANARASDLSNPESKFRFCINGQLHGKKVSVGTTE